MQAAASGASAPTKSAPNRRRARVLYCVVISCIILSASYVIAAQYRVRGAGAGEGACLSIDCTVWSNAAYTTVPSSFAHTATKKS